MTGTFNGLGFGIAITLTDAFSAVAKKVDKSMTDLNGGANSLAKTIGKELTQGFANLAGAMGATVAIGAAINMAAKMSDTLTDVADATGMSTSELEGLRSELEGISTRRSLTEQLDLAAVGHQIGIAKEDLADFVRVADAVGVSLEKDFGSASEAATQITRLGKTFSDTKNLAPTEAMGRVANALDMMSDNARVSASDVSAFALKLAQSANISGAAAIGLGTALTEMGIKAKPAAAAIQKISQDAIDPKKMGALASFLGKTTAEIENLANTAPDKLFMDMAARLGEIPADQQTSALAKLGIKGGQTGNILKVMAQNTDLVRKRMDMASESIGNMDGITDQFNAKNENLAGVIQRLVRAFTNLWTRVGEVIGGALSPFMDIIESIIGSVTALLANPFVKEVLKWGIAITLGALALYGLSRAVAYVRVAMQLLSVQARAAFLSMLPLMAIAAPFIVLFLVIKKANDAFSSFSGKVQTGFGGFLQRFGGIIATIREVWSSWDTVNQQFSLSQGLLDKLDQLGIRELALSVATWVVRVKEFLGGIWEGFSEVFSAVGEMFSAVMSPIIWAFDQIGFSLARNTSSTETWKKVGKALAYTITAALGVMAARLMLIGVRSTIAFGGMIVKFGIMIIKLGIIAVQSVLAFWPMILMAVLIGAAIYVVIKIFQKLWEWLKVIWEWIKPLVDFGVELVQNIWDGIVYIWDTFTGWVWSAFNFLWEDILKPLYDVGVNIVMSIWEGIKAVWNTMVDWITTALARIPGVTYLLDLETPAEREILKAAESGKKFTMSELTPMIGMGQLSEKGINRLTQMGAITDSPQAQAGIDAARAVSPNVNVNVPEQKEQKVPEITLMLDSDVIGRSVTKFQEEQESRK